MSIWVGPVMTSKMANFVIANSTTIPMMDKTIRQMFDFFAFFLNVSNILFPPEPGILRAVLSRLPLSYEAKGITEICE